MTKKVLKIIAVDGLYLRAPIPARGFELAPGNRLDVDLSFDRSTNAPLEIWDRFIAVRPRWALSSPAS